MHASQFGLEKETSQVQLFNYHLLDTTSSLLRALFSLLPQRTLAEPVFPSFYRFRFRKIEFSALADGLIVLSTGAEGGRGPPGSGSGGERACEGGLGGAEVGGGDEAAEGLRCGSRAAGR